MTFRILTILGTILLIYCAHVQAQNHIITVNVSEENNLIHIEPKLNFSTSSQIKEAIDNGIRVQFIIKAQLYQPRSWWFDRVVENTKITLEVSYFTLGKLYIVKNKATAEQLGFNEYEQVWKNFEKLMTFNYEKASIENKSFKLRIMLDKGALPTAMQLPVFFDSNWDVNTTWYQHNLGQQ